MRLLANAKTKHIVFLATARFIQTLTMSLHKIPIIDFMILFFFLPEDVNSELVSQGSCFLEKHVSKTFSRFQFLLA